LFHVNFANRNELLHFEKDLAIAGGMFVLMLRGAGGYSVRAFASRKISYDDDGWERLVRVFKSSGNDRDEAMASKKPG
jgi:putative oxidoreductase